LSYKLSGTATLHCPPDQTLPCTSQTSNLMAYGDAYIMKHGIKYDAGLAAVTYNINSCNVGTIQRKWQIEDGNGQILQCTQTLTFTGTPFGITNITWPATELEIQGCEADLSPDNLPQEYQRPFYYHGICNHVGQNYHDEVYIFGPDCKKVVREWTVIDWCTYVPGSSQGIFKFYQTFKLNNDSSPILSCPQKVTVVAKNCDASYVNLPLATIEGTTCDGTGNYRITNTSVYSDTTTQDASGIYPVGKHYVNYKADYACGKETVCFTEIEVIDPNPVPYCLATIHVVLMGIDDDNDGVNDEGMVDVWAKDVNYGSYHPCHDDPLQYSFEADSIVMSRTFTCQEIGLNEVNMYVSDSRGKQSYCRVHIVVQNNGANIYNCQPETGSRPITAGVVCHPNAETMEGVYVSHRDMAPTIEGNNSYQVSLSKMTGTSGSYSNYDELPMHRDYEISAYKTGDVTRMDSDDAAILESYIKGEQSFKSSYTYLSADLNSDGVVDVNDFHMMNNLMGKPESDWPDQMQWRFYTERSLGFIDPYDQAAMPTGLQDYYEVKDLYWGYGQGLNFIGILKGDLTFYENMSR